MSTRTDRHQTYDRDGNVVSERTEVVDTTAEDNALSVAQQLAQQALAALAAARTAAAAQMPALQTLAGTSGNLSAAQLSNAVRGLADAQIVAFRDCMDELAKIERLLVRAVANIYDAAD